MSARHVAVLQLPAAGPPRRLALLLAGTLGLTSPMLAARAGASGWEPLGPETGVLTALAEAPNGRTLYAGTLAAGVFRSADGGRSWRRLPAALPAVSALAVDAVSSSTLYAGTTEGLLLSRDGGGSWQAVALPFPPPQTSRGVSALLADPRVGGTCWAALGARGSLYRSRDGGSTWRPRATGLGGAVVYSLAAHPKIAGRLYAGTDRGVYASRDAGAHWVRLGLKGKLAIEVTVDSGTAETVHAVTIEPVNHYGVTVDRLYHFAPGTAGTFRRDPEGTGPGNGIYTRIASDPFTPGLSYAATSVGLFVQTRAGGSWDGLYAQPAGSVVASRVHAGTLFLIPSFFGADDGALLVSRNGGDTWASADRGLSTASVQQIALDPAEPRRLFARIDCCWLWRSEDEGASWTRIAEEIPIQGLGRLLFDPNQAGTLYLPANLGQWKSGDRGDSWQSLGTGVRTLAIDPNGPAGSGAPGEPGTLYGADSIRAVMARSRDGGASWEELPGAAGFYVSLLAVPATAGPAPWPLYANGYAVPAGEPYTYRDRLRRSLDGGATWSTLLLPERGDTIFTALAADGAAGGAGRIYASFYEADRDFRPVHGGVFRSTDGGATWESLGVTASRPPVNTIALDPGDPRHLFAGTSGGGIYESRDGGTSWNSIAGGLPRADVTDLELDPRDPHRLYAALSGAGLFRQDL